MLLNNATFIISGISEYPINDDEITFSFDEYNNGYLKNVTCEVNYLENSKYEFICNSKQRLKTNLQGSMGKTPSGENVIINFSEDNNGNITDYINIDIPEKEDTFINVYRRKRNSGGFPAGAIAGIIIGCLLILIAVIICACACRKKRAALVNETTEIYNVNNSVNPNY